MYEIQWIISAGAKMGSESEKYPNHQTLLWDLYLPHLKATDAFTTYSELWWVSHTTYWEIYDTKR